MVMQLVSSKRKFLLKVNSLELAMDLDLGLSRTSVIKFNYLFGFGDARLVASIVHFPKLKICNQHHDRSLLNLNSDYVLTCHCIGIIQNNN